MGKTEKELAKDPFDILEDVIGLLKGERNNYKLLTSNLREVKDNLF